MSSPLKVTVEVTSDVVCPWCWVGKRQLDIAIDKVRQEFDVHVKWRPFNLNPWLPEQGMSFKEYAVTKFGEDGLKRFITGQVPFFQRGKEIGIEFNYSENTRVVPTKSAHILLDHASKYNLQHKLKERLFGAYYIDGYDISNTTVLGDILVSVGMDREEGLSALNNPLYVKRYEEEIKSANDKGITGVPNFDVYLTDAPNGIHQSFSGAQSVDTIIAVLRRLKLLSKV